MWLESLWEDGNVKATKRVGRVTRVVSLQAKACQIAAEPQEQGRDKEGFPCRLLRKHGPADTSILDF